MAQSNAAYMLDRKESEVYDAEEMWKRALVYWSRSAAQVLDVMYSNSLFWPLDPLLSHMDLSFLANGFLFSCLRIRI